jgi:cytochrome P450
MDGGDVVASAVRTLKQLPAPKGLPLLGNAHQLELKRLHQVLENWCAELGPLYTVRLGLKPALVCAEPELIQTVLRERPHRYRRFSPIESVLAELGGNGVFSAEGEAWRPQRQLIMRALAATNFRGFFPVLQAITHRLQRRWLQAARQGEVVDMGRDLVRYTVDVTTALAFGEDPNTLEQQGDVIQDHLALIFPMIDARIGAPFPLWRYIKLPKDRAFERSLTQVHQHVASLIARAKRRMRDDPVDAPRNLLEAMLLASEQPDARLSEDVIAANVLTLLLAGEDTTAHTLAWTMPYLAADAKLQDSLHAAALQVLGARGVAGSFDDIRHLDLFEAAAQEATRLRPIAPFMGLEPLHDLVLGDVALPADTPVFLLLRPAMLDARNFSNPQVFDPTRWMPGHNAAAHNARAYAQFGAGPRVCPGRHLAGVELRLVLSMLMRNFSLELATDPASIRETMAFTMTPSHMPVRLRERQPAPA